VIAVINPGNLMTNLPQSMSAGCTFISCDFQVKLDAQQYSHYSSVSTLIVPLCLLPSSVPTCGVHSAFPTLLSTQILPVVSCSTEDFCISYWDNQYFPEALPSFLSPNLFSSYTTGRKVYLGCLFLPLPREHFH
jgi:hypothetical protein